MRRLTILLLAISLNACSAVGVKAPETPGQLIAEAQAVRTVTAEAFVKYSLQPFCGDAGAPVAPLCADRTVVREGYQYLVTASAIINDAEAVIKTTGTADTNMIDKIKSVIVSLRNLKQKV